jgi:hypothetical protein
MNRGLLEFKIKAPFFSSSTKLGINYGSDPGADRVYQSILVPYATGIDVYAYLPRNPYFQLNYFLPGGLQPRKPIVEIDWINKRYRFSSGTVYFETSMVPNCQSPGYFGLLIPASSVPDTTAAASPTCSTGQPTSANFFIKDLGAGFY